MYVDTTVIFLIFFFAPFTDDENCPPLDDVDMENMRIYSMIFQRMKNTYSVQLNCLSETFFYYRNMAYEWVKQQMGTI